MRKPGETPRSGEEPRVFFEYCISLVFLTLRLPSKPWRAWPWPLRLLQALPYTVVTLLFGWWGLPWGLIHTPLVLWTNLSGGRPLGDA
jgi:hypothetical protein